MVTQMGHVSFQLDKIATTTDLYIGQQEKHMLEQIMRDIKYPWDNSERVWGAVNSDKLVGLHIIAKDSSWSPPTLESPWTGKCLVAATPG